jgi:5-methylthioadenosine/S-adenosylhomocysteine deaminase
MALMGARLCSIFLLLLASRLSLAQTIPIALTGTVLSPSGVIENGTVLFQGGKILAVGAGVRLPPDTKTVATHGIILPGFIDLHNHLTWNVFPRWKPTQEFGSRYDWQQKPIYKTLMDAPHHELVAEGFECDMERYAEVKAVSEGETSVVGGTKRDCGKRLDHNLDLDPRVGTAQAQIIYEVFPFQMTEEQLAKARATLDLHGALLIHVAEGAPGNASSAREFTMLKDRGLLREGVSLIHGVALKSADFREMADAGVGFVWSPRSNLELYGDTANVAAAKAAGVSMAIAPDWSSTGSDGTLAELNFAAAWNAAQTPPVFTDRELVNMATSGAAKLARLDKSLGSLAAGYAADIVVLRPHSRPINNADAYWSVVHSDEHDVELVVIGGEAVYDDPQTDEQLGWHGGMEQLTICGVEKEIASKAVPDALNNFQALQRELDHALAEWGRKLAPLAECGQ